jgi:hypothetical protein
VDDEQFPTMTVEKETQGGETVELPLEDTNLPAGSYFVDSIILASEPPPAGLGMSWYRTDESDAPYLFITTPNPDGQLRCRTEIPAATLVVVD